MLEFMQMFWTTCTDYIKRDSDCTEIRSEIRERFTQGIEPELFCEDCTAVLIAV